MRHNVLNVTAVLADGTVFHTAQRARKSSAGFDLTRLLVGSEGTLALVTEVTLRLSPVPERVSVGVCAFDSVKTASHCVMELMRAGVKVPTTHQTAPLSIYRSMRCVACGVWRDGVCDAVLGVWCKGGLCGADG